MKVLFELFFEAELFQSVSIKVRLTLTLTLVLHMHNVYTDILISLRNVSSREFLVEILR